MLIHLMEGCQLDLWNYNRFLLTLRFWLQFEEAKTNTWIKFNGDRLGAWTLMYVAHYMVGVF
jgi:hypothetical protein